MTEKELRNLYQTACDGKGYIGNEGQFKVWKQTLGWCEERDLAKALVAYFQDNTGFPMPAELKTLAESARRARITAASAIKELVRWRCPDCGIYRSGFLEPADHEPRICHGIAREGGNCGGLMEEIHRKDADAETRYSRTA